MMSFQEIRVDYGPIKRKWRISNTQVLDIKGFEFEYYKTSQNQKLSNYHGFEPDKIKFNNWQIGISKIINIITKQKNLKAQKVLLASELKFWTQGPTPDIVKNDNLLKFNFWSYLNFN